MAGGNGVDPKLAELTELLDQVRARVRERHAQQTPAHLTLPDLLPILHARDAAYGKVAAIGRVNPRAGGPLNSIIQSIKRTISRSLGWFVRDQVDFNQSTITSIEAVLAALEENNRALKELASRISTVDTKIEIGIRESVEPAIREFNDLRSHWIAWRADWVRKLEVNEVQFLRGLADLQNDFHRRLTQMEANYRDIVKSQHADFEGALARSNNEIQQRLWTDIERARDEFFVLVHEELRRLRQKAWMFSPGLAAGSAAAPASAGMADFAELDWWLFADKFRGPEEYVRRNHEFYLEHFRECRNVVDLGCGRGEFLSLLKEHNIPARGIELSQELVQYGRSKGLNVDHGDMFASLAALPEESVDGLFCAQVVEHLPPPRVWELIRLAHSRLTPRGVLVIETPNPECLAIFSSHFFIDPTHTRPIPPVLMEFYFEENGFRERLTRRFAPAIDSIPELANLPEDFRNRMFGSLDYAVIGRKN